MRLTRRTTTLVMAGLLTALATATPAMAVTSATTGMAATPDPAARPVITVDTATRIEIRESQMWHELIITSDKPVDDVGADLEPMEGNESVVRLVQQSEYVLVPGTTSTYRLEIHADKFRYPYWGTYVWSVDTQTSATETTPYLRSGKRVEVVVRLGSTQSVNTTRADGITRVTGETRHTDPRTGSDYEKGLAWPGQKVTVERLDETTDAWVLVGTAFGDQRGRFTVKTREPAGTQFRARVSRTAAVWGSISPTKSS